jgi:hypothetical protein
LSPLLSPLYLIVTQQAVAVNERSFISQASAIC